MIAVAVLLSGAALSAVPGGPVIDQIEMVEINHCYNRETGERRFVQVIYWDHQDTACLHVRHWHMAEKLRGVHRDDHADTAGYVVVRQIDGPARLQTIRARQYRVTHTFDDPEEVDRQSFPIEARRPLK